MMPIKKIRIALALIIYLLITFFVSDQVLARDLFMDEEKAPQIFGVTLGIETGIISRDIVEEDPGFASFKVSSDAVSTRFLAKIGLRFFDRIEIYGKGGGADLSISDFNDYDARPVPAYGGGIRLDLYQGPRPEGIKLFLDANFLYFVAEDTIQILDCPLSSCSDSDLRPRMANEEIRWREGDISAGGSFRHDYFEPYGGVRLSFVRGDDILEVKEDTNFPDPLNLKVDLDEDDNFGIFFGTNIYLDRRDKSAISLEFSAIDQFAFIAGFKAAF